MITFGLTLVGLFLLMLAGTYLAARATHHNY